MDEARLRTIWHQRQFRENSAHLSEPLTLLMKHTLGKKVRQLGKLSEIWDTTVPEEITSHTALESFSRGTLTVTVDTSAHRFQLRTLLNGGLMKILQQQFSGALNRIRLVPGQFYSTDATGARRYEF